MWVLPGTKHRPARSALDVSYRDPCSGLSIRIQSSDQLPPISSGWLATCDGDLAHIEAKLWEGKKACLQGVPVHCACEGSQTLLQLCAQFWSDCPCREGFMRGWVGGDLVVPAKCDPLLKLRSMEQLEILWNECF